MTDRRKGRTEMTGYKQAADHILKGADDINVVVGPVCWRPSDGTSSKMWYFVVATSETRRGFRCDQLVIGEGADPHEGRAAFMLALANRGPLVVHDTDDELYMAKLCEALWPGERISNLCKTVEAERRMALA